MNFNGSFGEFIKKTFIILRRTIHTIQVIQEHVLYVTVLVDPH